MFGRLVRMRADILLSILISIIAAFIITGLINIDRIYYGKAVALEPNADLVGYPAGSDVVQAKSIAQIESERRFTLALDGSRLVPTGRYRRLSGGGKYARNKLSVWVESVSGEEYGQFYVVELESGEKIVVLLDDFVVSTNKNNLVLPIGTVERTVPTAMFKELRDSYGLSESDWFADLAGNSWRTTEMGQKASSRRSTLWFGALIGTFILLQLLFRMIRVSLFKK